MCSPDFNCSSYGLNRNYFRPCCGWSPAVKPDGVKKKEDAPHSGKMNERIIRAEVPVYRAKSSIASPQRWSFNNKNSVGEGGAELGRFLGKRWSEAMESSRLVKQRGEGVKRRGAQEAIWPVGL